VLAGAPHDDARRLGLAKQAAQRRVEALGDASQYDDGRHLLRPLHGRQHAHAHRGALRQAMQREAALEPDRLDALAEPLEVEHRPL
jgi:hypothetical protein